ncbi:transglutaminase domain-containing protein [Candidatus Woesearchaeota archaeon]|nr:transglutaminase domain-containing protein [Candidatus Woesearchaeota archaeon]
MEKKKIITLFSCVVILLTIAGIALSKEDTPLDHDDNWFYESKEIVTDFTINTKLKIVPASEKYILEKVITDLSFYPREDYRQKILSLETEPKPAEINDNLQFIWYQPKEDELEIKVSARVDIENKFVRVKERVPFPVQKIPAKEKQYLQETTLIDFSKNGIQKLANDLSEGETDEYEVVFTIANWVKNNIEYSLSTVTADAALPASWVLENRKGVCDELTNLFIAMLRSVGIPARFVAGYSYTNSELFTTNWGPHGWAEVYFPEYGWIPFDVTYGEFGFVDATHIKLKESLDADKTSTKYEWHGRDVNLEVSPLEFEAKVVEQKGKVDKNIIVESQILGDEVTIGSHNLLVVSVENTKDYYVPVELLTSKSEGLTIYNPERAVLLKPLEKRKLLWKIRTDGNLDGDYVYTFFINTYTILNESDTISFNVKKEATLFSEKDINEIIDVELKKVQKSYEQKIDLACAPENEAYYQDEEATILCTIKNTGNSIIKDLNVCSQDCLEQDLLIAEEKSVKFKMKNLNLGQQNINIKAKNKQIAMYVPVTLKILDRPMIELLVIHAPEKITIDDTFKIEFKAKKKSASNPNNVEVIIRYNEKSETWHINELENEQTFILNVNPYDLYKPENNIIIETAFYDQEENRYHEEKTLMINLEPLTTKQKMLLLLKNPQAKGAVLIIIGAASFIGLILFMIGWKQLTKHHKQK